MKSVKLSIMGLVVIIIANLYFIKDAFSWSEKTHKDLSVYAAESSVLDKYKGNYLSNLGFDKGLKEIFEWNGSPTIKRGYIQDWLSEGARLEDEYTKWDILTNHARFNNHFHNPLKPWDEAGLNDTFALRRYTGISSIKWAQDGRCQQDMLKSSKQGDKMSSKPSMLKYLHHNRKGMEVGHAQQGGLDVY